jgi:hypothetical protein
LSSELVQLECFRTIDRARIRFQLADTLVASTRSSVLDTIRHFELIPVSAAVLQRASEPFPTLLGSLDAIHLASALLVREANPRMTFATHDRELATAARSVGFTLAT